MIWKAVKGYEGLYEVSDAGEVKLLECIRVNARQHRRFKEKILRPRGKPYSIVALWKNGIGRDVAIHKLVAEAFLGPCPAGFEVNHKDGKKRRNLASNLEYQTRQGNVRHAYNLGLNKRRKISPADVAAIRAQGASVRGVELAAKYGISCGHIHRILTGKSRDAF